MNFRRLASILPRFVGFSIVASSLAACKSTSSDAAGGTTAVPSAVPAPSGAAGPNGAPAHGSLPGARPPEPLEKLGDGRIGMGPFSLSVPANWTEVPRTSSTRTAHYRLPAPEGSKAELIVYYFGERGAGSVQENIDRWLSQFRQPGDKPSRDLAKVEKIPVAGREATLVSVSGRYVAPATPGGPAVDEPDQALLAAIVESPRGPYYFRLIGSRAVIAEQEPEFRALLASLGVHQAQ